MGEFAKIARKRKIVDLGWGLAARMTDLSLVGLYLGLTLALPSKHTGKFLSQIFRKIHGPVDETKIKNSLYQLKRQGLIDYGLRLWQTPQITRAGKDRLKQLLPSYDDKRVWDKRLYLISYDIPNSKKAVRDNLRRILKTIGCGLLQESVWICPFPLEDKLKEYFSTWKLRGEILVSKSEVLVGDQKDIAWRVWHLSRLSKSYRRLIEWWQSLPQKGRNKSTALSFQQKYFSLLFSDPFLPAELLPKDWPGSKAGFLFTQQVSKLLNR